jgi:hypothetical protein
MEAPPIIIFWRSPDDWVAFLVRSSLTEKRDGYWVDFSVTGWIFDGSETDPPHLSVYLEHDLT